MSQARHTYITRTALMFLLIALAAYACTLWVLWDGVIYTLPFFGISDPARGAVGLGAALAALVIKDRR